MILNQDTLQAMIEKNDEANNVIYQEDEFFDELYLKDRLRLSAELGLFIGHQVGHVRLDGIHMMKDNDLDEEELAIWVGVGVIRKALTLVTRSKQAVAQEGYMHDETHGYFDVESYGSHKQILGEYRELFRYHDPHLLVKMSEMHSHRNLSGIVAGVLIILERLGVDELMLVQTFDEQIKGITKEMVNQ